MNTATYPWRMASPLALLCLLAAVSAPTQPSDGLIRLSETAVGVGGNGPSGDPSVSSNGRFIAFVSSATNLAPGPHSQYGEVMVIDRSSGQFERITIPTGGGVANEGSIFATISGDGRFVAYRSAASNLVAGDTNQCWDIFVRDRQSGTTERVSVTNSGDQGNSNSDLPTINSDGRFVAFDSSSSNLVASDRTVWKDIVVRDRNLGTNFLASISTSGVQANDNCSGASISNDGRYVTFWSKANNLVAGDTNNQPDVFVRDRDLGTTERISLSSNGTQGNGASSRACITGDGRYICFVSSASNLASDDLNNKSDIFVRDRLFGTTELVSRSAGRQSSNGASQYPSISSNGRLVAYSSNATNLDAADTRTDGDVYLCDRIAGTTRRLTVDKVNPRPGFSTLLPPTAMSSNGEYVAFSTLIPSLVEEDTNGVMDVFLTPTAIAPPTAVTLQAAAISASEIELAWSESSGAYEYEIERRTPTGSFELIASVPFGQTTYVNSGLPAGTSQTYRVRPTNGRGLAPISNEVTAITFPALPAVSLLRANLHSHTTYSDGVQPSILELFTLNPSPTAVFQEYAAEASLGEGDGPQVWAVTDHYPSVDYPAVGDEWQTTHAATTAAPGIIGLRGFEWSPYENAGYPGPHINVIGSAVLPRRIDGSLLGSSDELFDWLATTDAIGQINHAESGLYPWAVRPVDARVDQQIALFEVGSGLYNIDKYDLQDTDLGRQIQEWIGREGEPYTTSFARYLETLLAGWHVGAVNNQDNHFYPFLPFGDQRYWVAPTNNTGVWVEQPTADGVLDALRKRRVFASEDANFRLNIVANGCFFMGSQGVPAMKGNKIQLRIRASDSDEPIRHISVLSGPSGGSGVSVLWNEDVLTSNYDTTLEFQFKPNHWYLVYCQQEGIPSIGRPELIVSSPIWTR